MLIHNEIARRVSEFLRPGHFYHPVHWRIFDAIVSLSERGQIANPVTFDETKYTVDLDSCRGGTVLDLALQGLGGAALGSAYGLFHGVSAGVFTGISPEGAAIGAAVGGVIGVVVGAY